MTVRRAWFGTDESAEHCGLGWIQGPWSHTRTRSGPRNRPLARTFLFRAAGGWTKCTI